MTQNDYGKVEASVSIAAAETQVEAERPGGADDTPAVRVGSLVKSFRRANGTTITPVDHISLSIAKGEFVVLLGPSGCGKTTLLRCIAGLEQPDEGSIDIMGTRVLDRGASRNHAVPPERRGLGMIFQSYALWPHMTAAKNVAYPLEAAKTPKAERRERVARALEIVGVSEIADQLPGRLSGGQQQRVSLARALVAEPPLILFDEPLSNVDAKVREELRIELLEMQRRIGFTAIYVTHDQVEAMELADRIAVLHSGTIAQFADPATVYDRPASRYVAKFIGAANELSAEVVDRDDTSLTVTLPGVLDRAHVPVPASGAQPVAGDRVHLIWRPERSAVTNGEIDGHGLLIEGQTLLRRYLGAYAETIVSLRDGSEIRVVTPPRALDVAPRSGVRIAVQAADLRVFAEENDT